MKIERLIESIIKKILKIKPLFGKIIRSAEYNTNKGPYIFLNSDIIGRYILKYPEEISKKLYIDQSFDHNLYISSQKFLKKKKYKYLINIGAHVGSTIIPLLKKNFFEKCIAFEPSFKNFNLLRTNILINNLENKTKLFNIALSNNKGFSKLNLNSKFNSGDYVLSDINKKRILTLKLSEKCPCYYDDNLIVQTDILNNYWDYKFKKNCILFIDAQGSEYKILSKGLFFLKEKVPIIMELEPSLIKKKILVKKIFEKISHYKFFVDLKYETKKKMIFENFEKLYFYYLEKKTHTDILIF